MSYTLTTKKDTPNIYIPNQEEIKQITGYKINKIKLPNRQEIEDKANIIAQNIAQSYCKVLNPLLTEYQIRVNPKIKDNIETIINDMKTLSDTKINQKYLTAKIIPPKVKITDPDMLYFIIFKNNDFDIISEKKNDSFITKRIQNLSQKEVLLNDIIQYQKTYNTTIIGTDKEYDIIHCIDPEIKITSDFFLSNLLGIKKGKSFNQKIAFKTAKYFIEPFFYKANLINIDRNNTKPLNSLIYATMMTLGHEEYISLDKIQETNKQLYSMIINKLKKGNTVKKLLFNK